MKTQNAVLIFLFLLLPALSSAQGFHMNTQGVRASGMGGSAIADDASTVYYNPAALSQLEKSKLTAGVGIIFPRISYLDPYSGNIDMDPAISFPFHVYGAAKLKGKLSAGIGIYTPYSENISWEDNWAGRFIIIENRFRSLNVQPVVSYKIGEHFSLGAGPVISLAAMTRTIAVDISSSTFTNAVAEHKSSSTGFGFTAAAHVEINAISIGATYHSAIDQKMKNGETSFNDISQDAALFEGIPSAADFTTEITMPASGDLCVTYKPNDKLKVTVNGNYTLWSSSETLVETYEENKQFDDSLAMNFDDAVSFSAGGRYQYTAKTTFRAGIGWTKSHVPSGFVNPSHPDADHFIYSGGLSWLWKEGFTLDFSLMVKDYKPRKESANMLGNFTGDYKSTLYIAGIGINYEF